MPYSEELKAKFRNKYGNYDEGKVLDLNKAAKKHGIDTEGMTNEEISAAILQKVDN